MNATPIPTTMRVLRAHHRGGPEALVVEETPTPQPGPDEVLVAVHAAAITFDELRWDETWSHLPSTPSHEWSGVVAALGSGTAQTSGLTVGDEVFGMVPFDRDGAACGVRRRARRPGRSQAGVAHPRRRPPPSRSPD